MRLSRRTDDNDAILEGGPMDDCKDRDILVVTTTVPTLAQGQALAQRMEGSPAYFDWVRTEVA
jgi:F420-0:gamma-glutamyl ligase